jgi:Ca2+-binding RTX toxin-like protein
MTTNGTPGNDTLNGGPDNDVLYGLDGDDRLYGNEGNDTLNGDAGGDYLFGGSGNDSMNGGSGYDYLYGGAGDDTLDGGADSDSIFFYSDATGPISVNLVLGTATGAGIGSDTLISVENVYGSQYADILTGDLESNYLQGSNGNDTLTGGAGSDAFDVWNGTAETSVDTITDFTAGLDGDRLSILPWEWTNYTSGDNPFVSGHARLTQSGANTLFEVDPDGTDGAAGFRIVAILNNVTKSHLVAANLGGFDPNAIAGTAADNLLTGSTGNDQIYGLAGNDTVNGLVGEDSLYGGSGNDVLDGGEGSDQLYGNEGNDSIAGGDGNDPLYGNEGNDSIAGGAGSDWLYGGAGDDTLDGGAGSDSAFYFDATGPITVNLALGTATGAGIGSDTLISIEEVIGSQYADILTGDAGSNSLQGSSGNDTLSGGAGSDYFDVWYIYDNTSVDTITDFTAGVGGDRLSMPTWWLTNYTFMDNPFVSGHMRLTQSGANILFEVDQDGSVGAAGFRTVAILNNVTKSHLVADNLGGFDPNAIGGTTGPDSLTGSAGNDQIYGLAGNDTLSGLRAMTAFTAVQETMC